MRTSLTPVLFLIAVGGTQAQWETLADVPTSLTFPVVVALNGDIHVVGGGGTQGATGLHLRYAPATDQWDTLAPVPYNAQQPCGAVVNGKIHYCGGGYPNSGTPLAHHYAYDPANDTWSPAADLPFPTVINEAAELDGQIYVMSGQPQRDLCQRYDPVSDSWTTNNDLPDDDFWYGAIVSNGETIYRFGGGGYIAPVNLAMVYDKVNDSWSYVTDMSAFRHAPAGCALGDSVIVVSGGYWNGEVDDVWLYHIATQTYTTGPSLPSARAYHSMVSIGGCVYSIGGNGADDAIAVSLLRNCTLVGTVSIAPVEGVSTSPYSLSRQGEMLTVHFLPGTAGPITVQVLDAAGRVLFENASKGGSNDVKFNGASLATGRYTVSVRIGSKLFAEDWAVIR
jgi:N-acetylneuraminic acid mutarotase